MTTAPDGGSVPSALAFFEAAFAHLPDAVAFFDTELRLVRANDAFTHLHRRAPELAGQAEEDLRATLMAGGTRQAMLALTPTTDGSEHRYPATYIPVPGDAEQPAGVVLIVQIAAEEGAARPAGADVLPEADEQRAKVEERVRLAVETAGLAAWEWDFASDEMIWWERDRRILGLPPGARLRFDQFEALVHPDDQATVRRAVRELLRTGDEFGIEHRLLRADGAERWVSVRGHATRDATGRVTRWHGVALDVTDRHDAEQHRAAAETLARDILDALAIFVLLLTPEGVVVQVNRPAAVAADQMAPTLVGHHLADTYGWEYSPELQARLRAAIVRTAAGETVRFDATLARPHGGFRTIDFTLGPVHGPDGNVRYLVASGADLSTRLALEEAVSEEHERLQAILSSTTEAVFGMDAHGLCTSVNPAGVQLFGYTPVECLGRSLHELVHYKRPDGSPFPLAECPVHATLTTGEAARFIDGVMWRKDGFAVDVLYSAAPLQRDGVVVGAVETIVDVSERRAAERALSESERRLHLALDAAGMGTWEIDIASGTVYASSGVDQMFDLPPAEPGTGRPFSEYAARMHPEDVPRLRDAITASAGRGEEYQVEYRLLAPDGSIRSVVARGEITRNAAGQPERLAGALIDNTDRALAARALQVSEERLRRFFDANPGGVVRADIHGKLFEVNDAFLDILGYTRAELEAARPGWADLTPPEFAPLDDRAIAEALERGACTPYEKQYIRKNGSRVWVLVGFVLTDAVTGEVVAFVLDIDARVRAEEAAATAARRIARLQEVTAAFSGALTLAEVAETVVSRGLDVVGAASGFVGLLDDDHTTLEIVAAHTASPLWQESVTRFRRMPLTDQYPVTLATRTATPVFVSSTAERDRRFPVLRGVASDHSASASLPIVIAGRVIGALAFSFAEERTFTDEERLFMQTLAQQCAQAMERARLYEAERTARETAEEVGRAKDEFLSVISHELRTPLTPLLAYSQMLRSRRLDERRAATALETIERSARAQAKLVEDILDVSRIITGKLQVESAPVNIASVATAAAQTVQPAADAKRVTLTVEIPSGEFLVQGDAGRLQQVMWNLLINAIKFTPADGRVTLSLERDADAVTLRVTDTGQGIPAAFLPHVFERFRQEDASRTREHGGLGLGLSIVRHLVELHGGTVRAESGGLGTGATFTVTLPLSWASVRPDQGEDVAGMGGTVTARLAGLRVLVVEDDADTRAMLRMVLEGEGASVVVATSAAEGVEAFHTQRPDVLVSDIGLPGEDGFGFIRGLRAEAGVELPPAIALTAYAAEDDRRRAEEAGFRLHLAKPLEPDALVSAVAEMARGQERNDARAGG